MINTDEKTIKEDVQTNVNKNNCNEDAITNFDNNNTVLQVNVNKNKVTSKDTQQHQDKDNDQEKILSSQKGQNVSPNGKEISTKSPRKIKTHHLNVKGYT